MKGIKEVAQKKSEQRKDPGWSPRKPHYPRLTLKLPVKELAESRDPRGKTLKETITVCREIVQDSAWCWGS